MAKERSAEELNKQLFKEKMQALKESKGDLGELVKRTPGASAKIIRENGDEVLLSKGPEADKYGLRKRGYSEHR